MSDPSRNQIALAREHLERREIDRAEQLLEQVAARSAGYADVFHLLALVARERGDFVRAVEHLERALAINPRYTEALLALAITFNDLGRYDESRAIREGLATELPTGSARAEDLDPYVLGKLANGHAALAQSYRDAACFDDAIRELHRAVSLRPEYVDLRVKLAAVLREAGRHDEAIAQAEDACVRRPGWAEAHVQLGLSALGAGHRDAARRAFVAALERDPSHERARTYVRALTQPDPARSDPSEAGG